MEKIKGRKNKELSTYLFTSNLLVNKYVESSNIEEIQTDLNNWMWYYKNERPHSGKYCYGKTPMQTFVESKNIAKEKLLENVMQQQNMLTFGAKGTIKMNHKGEI